MKRYILVNLFILFTLAPYAQNTMLKGKVFHQGHPISDALIIITTNDTIKLISDVDGSFSTYLKNISDSLIISVFKEGFAPIKDKTIAKSDISDVILNLTEKLYTLDEIIISADANTVQKAGKFIYKMKKNNFLKNTKVDIALNTIPNLSLINGDLLYNNRKEVIIFLDGVISSIEEVKNLNIDDVEKIEVIPNPSAEYGSDRKESILNIVRRPQIEHSFKGEISIGKRNKLNGFNITPSIAYKNKRLTLNALYFYTNNNQNVYSATQRQSEDELYTLELDNKIRGWQDYLSVRMNLNISPKLTFFTMGNINQYKFKSEINTTGTKYNEIFNTKEKLNKRALNGVLTYIISSQEAIIARGKYFKYHNNDIYYNKSNVVTSTIEEKSLEIFYRQKKLNLANNNINLSTGYKYVNRHNNLNNIIYNQNLNMIYSNWEIEINNNLSTYLSFAIEHTANGGIDSLKNYISCLPTLSILYKPYNNTNIEINYSKKITRPSANQLNPNIIFINPLYIRKGSPLLLPQSTHNIEVSATKIKGNYNIGIQTFATLYKKMITESYYFDNSSLITSYDNIGTAHSFGGNINFLKEISENTVINLNVGIDYTSLKTLTPQIINRNKGLSYNGNINLYTRNNHGWAFNFNCNYRSRIYTLTQTLKQQPLLTLSIEKNVLKDNGTISLFYMDILGCYSKSNTYINSPVFIQNSSIKNDLNSINLSFAYRFGKKFNGNIKSEIIKNNDIIIK